VVLWCFCVVTLFGPAGLVAEGIKIRNGVGETIDRGEVLGGFLCTMVAISLQKGCKKFARTVDLGECHGAAMDHPGRSKIFLTGLLKKEGSLFYFFDFCW
jgi:hypothetical protein